jgi:hypothetical protein
MNERSVRIFGGWELSVRVNDDGEGSLVLVHDNGNGAGFYVEPKSIRIEVLRQFITSAGAEDAS